MTTPEIDQTDILGSFLHLLDVRSKLLNSELSPEGAWLHEYTVRRRYPSGFIGEYIYAKWQAHEPIFKRNPKRNGRPPRSGKDSEYTCHQHIGRVGSNTGLGSEPEVDEAYFAYNNRRKLEAIDHALLEIQSILSGLVA